MIMGGKARILSGHLSTYRVGVGRNNIGIHLAVYTYICITGHDTSKLIGVGIIRAEKMSC